MALQMIDLIILKRNNKTLSKEQIQWLVKNIVAKTIPDYQLSAWAMAVCLNGMTPQETADLTLAMAFSGDTIDLSSISGTKVDKHSTGGVGDKVSLIVAPLMASLGIPVAKLSGRGLGHTGGTIDKLESLEGFRTSLKEDEFLTQVQNIGIALAGQTKNLAPADKQLYALRDVTGTVDSIPLIASSIMSKKIAGGADKIILDVKVGPGAFMKSLADAEELAKIMVGIGNHLNKKTVAILSRMEEPLGLTVGNSLEVQESIEILQGRGEFQITQLIYEIALLTLELTGIEKNRERGLQLIQNSINKGHALDKFKEFIFAQGTTEAAIAKLNDKSICRTEFLARESGYIQAIDAYKIGHYSMLLGAGRLTLESEIDHYVGLTLNSKTGDYIEKGHSLATVYHRKDNLPHFEDLESAYEFSQEEVKTSPIIHKIIV